MVKKKKLSNTAQEIVKLQRSVNRRAKQLEKTGEFLDIEKPEHKEPKTAKQAKEIIFKMESYLRQTSPDVKVREATARGRSIKENKAIEKDYKASNKVKKMASKAFIDLIKNPINEERKAKGLNPIGFKDVLEEFTIGSTPNKVKGKETKKEWAEMNRKNAEFFKNNPKNTGKLYIESMLNEMKQFVISQISKGVANDEFNDVMDKILTLSNKDFLLFYEENKEVLEALKYKYEDKHAEEIQSLTDSILESLGMGEYDEFENDY